VTWTASTWCHPARTPFWFPFTRFRSSKFIFLHVFLAMFVLCICLHHSPNSKFLTLVLIVDNTLLKSSLNVAIHDCHTSMLFPSILKLVRIHISICYTTHTAVLVIDQRTVVFSFHQFIPIFILQLGLLVFYITGIHFSSVFCLTWSSCLFVW
jgi:hypothetical protein